jgi:hypothetical protein
MTEKDLGSLSRNDKIVIGNMLQWQGKALRDCSKGELIDCVLHMTSQVVWLKDKLDKATLPFYKRSYWLNRFRVHGTASNTVCAWLFNRAQVTISDQAGNTSTVWRRASDLPKKESHL